LDILIKNAGFYYLRKMKIFLGFNQGSFNFYFVDFQNHGVIDSLHKREIL